MVFKGSNGEYLEVRSLQAAEQQRLNETVAGALSVVWLQGERQSATIDAVTHHFKDNDMVFLTEFHQAQFHAIEQVQLLRFNRAFYCITDHDAEIGCRGLLYFGASTLPLLHLDEAAAKKIHALWDVILQELAAHDGLQLEMLQMLLKRLLILCTRLYKQQTDTDALPTIELDLYRSFNFLVEQHFRDKHTVAEYADLLYKSPKTLSNWFKKAGHPSPLQLIQQRRMLEARRLLAHTDTPVAAVGEAIGFPDVQTFSRFFKRYEQRSPSLYRQEMAVAGLED